MSAHNVVVEVAKLDNAHRKTVRQLDRLTARLKEMTVAWRSDAANSGPERATVLTLCADEVDVVVSRAVK